MTSINSKASAEQRGREGGVHTMQAEIDDMLHSAKNSEEKAKKAMVDAARLADELRAEQDHVTQQANAKKALESQLGDMESRLNDANEHAMRGGRQAMAKLESRVRALELELGAVQSRTSESAKAHQKAERKIKELAFANDEDHKNQDQLSELASKLQQKIKTYKKQIEEAEEIAALNLAKYRKSQLDGHSGATPVEIDDGTQVVPMNTKIVIMGWGTNKENGTDGVNKLKDITIKKKGKNLCRNVYGSQVTSNNFCAKKNNKGLCTDSRDIGGPAIHKETGVQVGIISFSNEGQCSVDPVMLSKISAKYTWIMQQVEAMKSTSAPVSSPVGAVTSVPSDSPSEPPVPNVGNPSPVTPAPVTPAPVTPAPVTPGPVTPAPVTPAPVTPAPIPSPSAGPSAAPTTRAQVVIPVALTKLQSAVDIIEDEL